MAQSMPPIPSSQYAALKQLLGLTDDQVSKMIQTQTENAMFAEGKLRRIFQVNAEIDLETAKASLDAMALGVRYLELELICRDVREAAAAIPKKNLALLTDAQKAKLKLLEDAMNLAPTISQAQALQLLPGSSGIFGWSNSPQRGITLISSNVSACRESSIADFSIQP